MTHKIAISVRESESVTGLVYEGREAARGVGAPQAERPLPGGRGPRIKNDGRIGATLVLAHGAGAGQSSPFMVRFAIGLSSRGLDVLTFNFLYTEQRRRVPDRIEKLEACYRAAVETARSHDSFRTNAIFIGGKSMGGRIASHLAADQGDGAGPIKGLILLGYPLHPPGKPDQLRAAHLTKIRVPMLFVQGSRDPFGTPSELREVLDGLSASATLHLVENGDHSLAPPKMGLPRRPASAEGYGRPPQRGCRVGGPGGPPKRCEGGSAEREGGGLPSADQIYGQVQDTIVTWVKNLK